jgi:hypothetical protein
MQQKPQVLWDYSCTDEPQIAKDTQKITQTLKNISVNPFQCET